MSSTSDPLGGSGMKRVLITKLRFVSLRATRLHGVWHNPPSPTTSDFANLDAVAMELSGFMWGVWAFFCIFAVLKHVLNYKY